MIMYAAPGSASLAASSTAGFGGHLGNPEDQHPYNTGRDDGDEGEEEEDEGEEGHSSTSRSGSPRSSAYGGRVDERQEKLEGADEARKAEHNTTTASRGGTPRSVDQRWLVDQRAPTLRRMAKPTKFDLEMAALHPGATE